MLAHNDGGSEARFRRHLLNRHVRRFEQSLCEAYARVRDPRGWRRPHLLAKTTAERPRAHRRAPRDDWQRKVAREILFHPREQWCHGTSCFGWRRVFDELRLPARTLERHHG